MAFNAAVSFDIYFSFWHYFTYIRHFLVATVLIILIMCVLIGADRELCTISAQDRNCAAPALVAGKCWTSGKHDSVKSRCYRKSIDTFSRFSVASTVKVPIFHPLSVDFCYNHDRVSAQCM